ncbi:hypothetical protein BASA82_000447 [Batrachochytrium salamandrivorans]|nr:hypothetical protein BASA82_000447 [Batrachochytrium salamandrivorans]
MQEHWKIRTNDNRRVHHQGEQGDCGEPGDRTCAIFRKHGRGEGPPEPPPSDVEDGAAHPGPPPGSESWKTVKHLDRTPPQQQPKMNAPSTNEHIQLRGNEKKVTVVNDSKIINASIFYLAKEDHTLGNALRMSLLRDKDVRFAGYRMPHPLQFVCELKVQTTSSEVKPITTVISSLEALEAEFYLLENQFRAAFGGSSGRHSSHHQENKADDIMQLRM